MAQVRCLSVAIMLTVAFSQIHIGSSLQCYSCTNLVANNNFFGTFQPNEACSTFDPAGVEVTECGTSPLGQEAKCEKWEGSVKFNVPLVGSVNVSGVVRGCAFVPIGDALNSCASSTQLEGIAETAMSFVSQIFAQDVRGTYCSCDGDNCNGTGGLAGGRRTWSFAVLLVLLGRGIQSFFQGRQ